MHAVGPELERADLVVLSPLSDPMVLTYYAPRVKNVRLWDASLRPTIMNGAAERLHVPYITEAEILQAIKRNVRLGTIERARPQSGRMIFEPAYRLRCFGNGSAVKIRASGRRIGSLGIKARDQNRTVPRTLNALTPAGLRGAQPE